MSFEIKLVLFNSANGHHSYLSAGDSPLPTLYFVTTCSFAALIGAWAVLLRKNKEFIHHIHLLMLLLVILKCLSSLFRGVSLHFVKSYGYHVGWNVVYYVFAFLKGIMLFSVILLVGTGWSLIKPFLNDREKRILIAVIPLQVINQIALMVIEEMAPGSVAFLQWRDVLHVVDIVCCCMILFPIVWQIRQLQLTAAVDGKAEANMKKLMVYRNFYVIVVCYIYFTRIIVYLVGSTMGFRWSWIRIFFSELATLLFFCWTGWKFRPISNNPYLPVRTQDDDSDDDDEFGLGGEEEGDQDGIEMSNRKRGKSESKSDSVAESV